jgi:hypothetical protein
MQRKSSHDFIKSRRLHDDDDDDDDDDDNEDEEGRL